MIGTVARCVFRIVDDCIAEINPRHHYLERKGADCIRQHGISGPPHHESTILHDLSYLLHDWEELLASIVDILSSYSMCWSMRPYSWAGQQYIDMA